MSSDSRSTSLLLRFLDAFLQERNIKWVLATGMFILLGSSLLLVTTHWHSYTPAWKYLILLSYTAAIHGAGQWSTHRLGLRRTGTVLQGLTVLLIPVLFLALHWLPRDADGSLAMHLALLAGTLAFSLSASWRIFNHFLREPQPTFVLSYLTLAVAGAVVPGLPAAWAPATALALWAVFTAGTVKVNRHVFWLTEERRAPRVFGFLPIALLGSMFLLLFATQAAPHLELPWLGFGCVLVAIPVLLTADAVARVFQQRTGDLVRPLPWSVVVPFGAGLLLCAAGITLAGLSLATPNRAQPLALSAAGVAGLMALVARRTNKQAFVWAMLLTGTLAYNFSWVFFLDLKDALLANGARAVHEQRLPLAFYGLSYLPLLVGLMTAGIRAERAGGSLWVPLRRYCFGLSCLLLVLSLTHPKALFPVGVVLVIVFAAQARLFDKWYAVLPAILAWVSAAYGFTAFASQVAGVALAADLGPCWLALASTALLGAGRWIDPWVRLRVPASFQDSWLLHKPSAYLCQSASLLLSLGLAGCWFVQTAREPWAAWPTGALLACLLIVQSLRWLQPSLSAVALVFVQSVVLQQAVAWGLSLPALLSWATLFVLGQWLLGYVMAHHPSGRVARAFLQANEFVCCVWLTLLLVGVYFPLFLLDLARPLLPTLPSELAPLLGISWPCRLLILLWSFDAARQRANPWLTTLGSLGCLGLVGTTFLSVAGAEVWLWLPAVWTTTALAALPVMEFLQRRLAYLLHTRAATREAARCQALEEPITYLTFGVFCLAAVGSLVAFPLPLRVAGGLGLLGLLALSVLRRQPGIRLPSLVLVNWQVLGLTVLVTAPHLQTLFHLAAPGLPPVWLPLAFVAAGSLLLWQVFRPAFSSCVGLVALHRWALRVLVALALMYSLSLPELTSGKAFLAGAAFLCSVLAELVSACRHGREWHVWLAEVIAVLGVAYLAHFRVVAPGEASMFLILAAGFGLWLVKEWASRRPEITALVRPFAATALAMPLVTVALGLYRHVSAPPAWLGANSLALLLAAAFYFWRGLERRRKPLLILAAVILNVALVLLWGELAWSDPQFFMIPVGVSVLALVQLLHEEIPERLHDPLRYLGALVILVSPTFHIVAGSWAHLFSLMVASVTVMLLAIGLRVRALVYAGSAFLLADLAAMLVRGSIDNPNLLWIAGLLFGGSVLALGAFCERHRESLVQRMHLLADTLKTWD